MQTFEKENKKPTILILWQERGKQVQGLRHQLIDKDPASLSVYPSSQIKGNTRRTSMLRVCVCLCVTVCARKAVDKKRKNPGGILQKCRKTTKRELKHTCDSFSSPCIWSAPSVIPHGGPAGPPTASSWTPLASPGTCLCPSHFAPSST